MKNKTLFEKLFIGDFYNNTLDKCIFNGSIILALILTIIALIRSIQGI